MLIQAFAVGRAQEVLLILQRARPEGRLPDVPVFVDGTVCAVRDAYRRHPRYVTSALAPRIVKEASPFFTGAIRVLPFADTWGRRKPAGVEVFGQIVGLRS